MKKACFVLMVFFFSILAGTQELQHETTAVNIEVPVRVFDGDTFVDFLTIADFEVYEDGVLQKIDAVYLIKKTEIKKETKDKAAMEKKYKPQVSRYFVMSFFLAEYLPRAREVVDYFFDNVIQPGDTLTVITPLKTYNLKSEILEKMPPKNIKDQLNGILRKDITMGNSEYRHVIKDLVKAAQGKLTDQYLIALDYLKQLRYVDQMKLIQFADFLKTIKGQKYVFVFYQEESLPLLEPDIAEQIDPNSPGSMRRATFFMDVASEDISIDVDLLKRAYSDSLTSIHFLYITKDLINPMDIEFGSLQGMRFVDKSGDIFQAFNEIARTTGGISETSANISYSFKKAAYASENYYLLYYTPKNDQCDNRFRSIKVVVKDKKYEVIHRAGYVAKKSP
ncbi:MAG: hypothetical protein JXB26_11800 [Candidatus Aminicenantes bacterium]|nr:hypothetical protein [Candidatus Aminicenantes bacterium]